MEKQIGFLSSGHRQPIPGSQVRTGRDALVQTVELAVADEELGVTAPPCACTTSPEAETSPL